tara:strand:+ start:419 stop:562 length:144 start_codon:yes stop_codon:yes gene_type:complete
MDKELTEVLYETAKDFHRIGLVDDEFMFDFVRVHVARMQRSEMREKD